MSKLIEAVDEILPEVGKPARYIGNEYNAVHKKHEEMDVSIVLAFPDIYEIGMSHLGLKILYHLLNDRPDVVCERVFAPWVDMEKRMLEGGIPLFSLESTLPVADFDILGFTLQYEMSYTNLLNMIALAGIPLEAATRKDTDSLVIAGGPCAFNPEPLAPFIDVFHVGDSEEAICEIVDVYKDWKQSGRTSRDELLLSLSTIRGVYVPSFYSATYNPDGTLETFGPVRDDIPETIRKGLVRDLNQAYFPRQLIVPFLEAVHDRIPLEIARGCTRGCRFCQAGIIYRPVRERSLEVLKELAEDLRKSTGYEDLSLASLSTSDYSQIERLITDLMDKYEDKRLSISLPSLRADSFSIKLAQQVQRVRRTGLTLAPEAGTQRLRDVINKGVTREDLLQSVDDAVRAGWSSVKLYFMIGLPTETYDDVEGIVELSKEVAALHRKLSVTVGVSSFVPKPHTPFQWVAQNEMQLLESKQAYLKQQLTHRRVKLNWQDPRLSMLEAVFARGDRRLGRVLLQAWQDGCRFDSWRECFAFEKWLQAFSKSGLSPAFYATRERDVDELLPWDHIDTGISKQFLIKEREKALAGERTPDCRTGTCSRCGICSSF